MSAQWGKKLQLPLVTEAMLDFLLFFFFHLIRYGVRRPKNIVKVQSNLLRYL